MDALIPEGPWPVGDTGPSMRVLAVDGRNGCWCGDRSVAGHEAARR